MVSANSVNITTSGIQTFNASTGTFSASTVTQFGTVVAGTSNTVTSVAPSATSGIPLISQGSSSNPAFGTAVVAGGGTGNTSATAYAIQCGGTTSTGPFQSLASVGTAGQVLTSNGAGALPSFVNPPVVGGSIVLLSTQTASNSASISFTSLITSTYKNYFFMCRNVTPVTNNASLNLNWSTNNGTSYISTGYLSGCAFGGYNVTFNGNVNSTTTAIINVSMPNTASAGCNSTLWLMNLQAGGYPSLYGHWTQTTGPVGLSNSVYTTSTSVNAFQITCSTGNISTGTFSLYGIAE